MVYTPKILAFAGSLRKDSYNKKLIKIAVKGAEEVKAAVTLIDLKDFPLPIYDQDIETSSGIPENALKLKVLMMEHDGFLISCPEYNSSMPAVFKNMIDWVSRPALPNEVYLCAFIDKAVGLLSGSPGGLGGLRGLVHVRAMFGNINSIVIPQQKSVPGVDKVFDPNGELKDPKLEKEIMAIGQALALFISKYKGK